jgi:hypothetical protein
MDYNSFQSALLLGEADFSFTNAFSQVFQGTIIASEYSTGERILTTYFDGETDFLTRLVAKDNMLHLLASLDAKTLGNEQGCSCAEWNADKKCFQEEPTDLWNLLGQNHVKPIDLIIFNFPHTDKFGKAPKLLSIFFHQVQLCIQKGLVADNVVVELRLRDLSKLRPGLVRVEYKHEEAAAKSNFTLIGVYDNDLPYWQTLGYEHRMSRRNASCGEGMPCTVWRWHY